MPTSSSWTSLAETQVAVLKTALHWQEAPVAMLRA